MNNNELKMLQSLPLEIKIAKSKLRIEEFVRMLGGEDTVYISFSGGKDSTVLLHLVRSIYPNTVAVFSNTGLEFPEIVKFAMSKDNVITVKPEKSFKQVIEQFGYPMLSKKTARMISDLQTPTKANAKSRKLYLSDYTLDKDGNPTDKKNGSFKIAKKWRFLVDAPFKISHKCCDELKKKPIQTYEKLSGKRPIIGTMASESKMREQAYMSTGCNSFAPKKEKCNPLGFWTEQDILLYLKTFNVEFCSIYGDIIVDDKGLLMTTGEKRTGCVFCGFGIQLEKGVNRYQRLEKTHPQLHKYCMDKLGFKDVCEYMGIEYKN